MLNLTLYTRLDCHLCEDMQQALMPLQTEYGFSLHIVDIDADDHLRVLYNERIPLLMAGEQEICSYVLNETMLRNFLSK
ncbi:glutaredoxin family protein [Candidatus Venteria ishoeyi]|uniref:Glutaredoxin-like domain (DUF836) n=1 Tax=Candidatus Venteria ishoeyi TaxID=1899563 RepID=A0A1H6FCH7_9GAMM|nr:glutaredoxin family protein [Candidatus Venteria ishoeyi]SEH07790.1 Uncharacterised protein [Candidatus Venteria ishoeyi]